MQNSVSVDNATKPQSKKSVKAGLQKFGSFLSGMVMPNIGAFIAWGLITALFIAGGWLPNKDLAKLVSPMVTYLLPLLIGYTGGEIIADHRGGVVGAIATMGVIVGTSIPMFIGAMIMGPLGGYLIKKWDNAVQPHIKQGFEMLVNNFAAGILGMLLAIIGFYVMGPVVAVASTWMGAAVNTIITAHLLPLANIFIEPAKILFLNNAINQGILTPLGLQAAAKAGKSILFLLETNPGPGLGVLLAFSVFGKGSAKASAPSAAIIHFLGGIHEIYFPYVLMKPALFLAVIAGGVTGTTVFSVMDVGLKATASPGSIFTILAMSPRSLTNYLGLILGIALATLASFLVAAIILKRDKSDPNEAGLEEAADKVAAMKAESKSQNITEDIENAREAVANFDKVQKIIFACDAGMGSSAMGASLLRDKVKKAGIEMSVTNTAIRNLKDENGLLVITQEELAERAEQNAPNAMLITVDNFLSSPKYDSIVVNLKARDQLNNVTATTAKAEVQTDQKNESFANLNLSAVKHIYFIRHDAQVGTATMATSLMKDRLKKDHADISVTSVSIDQVPDEASSLVIVTPAAAKNLKTRYTNIQIFATDDLLNSPEYERLVLGLN